MPKNANFKHEKQKPIERYRNMIMNKFQIQYGDSVFTCLRVTTFCNNKTQNLCKQFRGVFGAKTFLSTFSR